MSAGPFVRFEFGASLSTIKPAAWGMGGCCAGLFRFVSSADSRADTDPSLVIPPNVFGPLLECDAAQRGAVLAGAMGAVRRIAHGETPQLWGSGQQAGGIRFTFELRSSTSMPSGQQELILESWEELP